MHSIRLVVIAVFSILLFTGISNAQDPDGRLFGLSSGEPARIYSINPETGTAVEVLETNQNSSIVGLSFLNGTPYGSDFEVEEEEFSVGFVAPDGTVTIISDQDGSSDWHGLASDDCDNALLYSIDNISDGKLLKELMPDGTVRTIGPGTGVDAQGMAFDDANGILYALDRDSDLYTISTETGLAELVGTTSIEPGILNDIGLAYDEIRQVLYAVVSVLDEDNTLYKIDQTNAETTLIGSLELGSDVVVDGLGWRDDCIEPEPIPTLSEWGLIATALVLGLVGLYAVRRRSTAV